MQRSTIKTVALLAIGSELLDGRVVDTNSNYLAKQISELGLETATVLSCHDNIDEICRALEFACVRADAVFITGGLGPTTDDLTREAVAKFCGVDLCTDESALEQIQAIFEKRGRKFSPNNAKQADFPRGASVIPNNTGTAPGFQVTIPIGTAAGKRIFSLPGVPAEMKQMFTYFVRPALSAGSETPYEKRYFKIFGLTESAVGMRVTESNSALKAPFDPDGISYRAAFPEIHLTFRARKYGAWNELVTSMRKAIEREFIFSEEAADDLPRVVHNALLKAEKSLGLAESCTGGSVARLLTEFPGSSKYLLGGVVSYSNRSKSELLAVAPELIKMCGAVSHETALAMAQGARAVFHSDIAVSITGIAGPDGGTEEKPVGTFFIAIAGKEKTTSYRFLYPLDRERIRVYASYLALDIVRRKLARLGSPPGALETVDA